MKMFFAVLLLSFLLAACGLKGPLHAPDKHTASLMFTSPLFYRVA